MIQEMVLKSDIQASLNELTADCDIVEKAEFNSAGIQKMFEKYGDQVPVSIFDFWYDKHKKLEQRVSSLENKGKFFLAFLTNHGVVLASRRHLHDRRNQTVMVEQRVRLGGPLPVVELRPVEKGQTQRYDRGVDAEDLPFQPVGLVLAVQPFRKA